MTSSELGLRDGELRSIIEIIAARPPVDTALIFGSRAKGTWRTGSDVDIALSGHGLCHDDLVELSCLLNEESILPYRFDLVDYRALQNQALREHIDRVGKVIFTRHAKASGV
jgi:predicted nucleotidyltransferase